MARNRNVFCILPECLQNDFLWLSGFIEADSRQEGRREPVVDLSPVFDVKPHPRPVFMLQNT